MSVKKQTSILFVVLFILLSIIGFLQFRAVQNIGYEWQTFLNQALERQVLLTKIQSQFGYGGFIHNFKNHVLRGSQKFVDRFNSNKSEMDQAFTAYEQLNLTAEEKKAMGKVKNVASLYAQAITTSVSMRKQGKGPAEIDKVVKIDDSPALDGMKILAKNVDKIATSATDKLNSRIKSIYVLMGVASLAMLLFFTLFGKVLFSMIKRLTLVQTSATELGNGNFSVLTKVGGSDEIASISDSLQKMSQFLKSILQQVQQQGKILGDSSEELLEISSSLSDGTRKASQRTDNVAAAAEDLSRNMTSVAAASDQASGNVQHVSAAIDEILASIEEEARQTASAQEVTQKAVSLANSSSEKVQSLGTAANEITKVTEVITEISEQTNLLALNATIEAARAGEAGKGFAVVANEIKELAKQTADATGEIKNKITSIQGSTNETVKEISQITEVIGNVDKIVTEISLAVQEQSATSGEISQNVTQASGGITEVNENVAMSSTVSTDIANNIMETSDVVTQLANSGEQVKDNAARLAAQVEELKNMTARFKL